MKFSKEATAVFDAGRVLWNYYHSQKFTSLKVEVLKALNEKYNANVSLYDIKEHFQGRSDKGRMNSKSKDAKYNELINNLRDKLIVLAKKIEPKVYEYGFLKE